MHQAAKGFGTTPESSWKTYDDGNSSVTTSTLYCNRNIWKDWSTMPDHPTLDLMDVSPCYAPSLVGWNNSGGVFDPTTETVNDTSSRAVDERGLMLQAVADVQARGAAVTVEAEAMSAPYGYMDSKCENGHDYNFLNPPPPVGNIPASPFGAVDSITDTNHQNKFAQYLGNVLGQLNLDLQP